MHLKLDAGGAIEAGDVARDLGQAGADILILSAADTELAGFAAAAATRRPDAPDVALTNILALGHPMSVDLFVARTVARAKIVVLRLIGGESYWPHGVASLRAHALATGTLFCCLPGETAFDPRLAARGTLDPERSEQLWRYCVEGGVDNLVRVLAFADHLLDRGPLPPPAQPMPAAGFWPAAPADDDRPAVPILFYRARALGFDTEPIEALAAALDAEGLRPIPIYVTSLKDPRSLAFLRVAFAAHPPEVILNTTAFATALADRAASEGLAGAACVVLQLALAGTSEADWRASTRGLAPRDLAMHVVMPEVDGRVFAGAVAFKTVAAAGSPATSRAVPEQVVAAAARAAAWVRLRRATPADRQVALVLANYPNRDGRLGNAVGLDTPASVAGLVHLLADAGYDVGPAPRDGQAVMDVLQAGPTNAVPTRAGGITWPLAAYIAAAARNLPIELRDAVHARWGAPDRDPFVAGGVFHLPLHRFGHLVFGVQPARGFDVDPKTTFHDADLLPPHGYVAFYLWLREAGLHAIAHVGKHGNLEWLPGKSTGLSQTCCPEALLGPVPHLYPFVVNDPGEGIQAKRRTGAVILDHLPPPATRAGLHDELARLETLIDEYAVAADLDPPRARALSADILASAGALRLDADIDAFARDETPGERLRALDAHLCDLKDMQIRDGLHVFGQSPPPERRDAHMVAIARVPRGSALRDASLHRAIAADSGLQDFDPLDTADLAARWDGARPRALAAHGTEIWRTTADTVDRVERLALALVAGTTPCPPHWVATAAVLGWVDDTLRPALSACGAAEHAAVLRALDGCFVPPGPAGAPTRGRPDVLPTGRNFFAVDVRGVPTPAAWRIGRAAAERLVDSYWQAEGDWPRAIAITAWGTAAMRTGGDDIAQVLALLGTEPVWEPSSGRVTGFTILPLATLGRPRVDVTLRVSGLFRDAFPTQLDLVDSAVRAVAALDEPADANPLAAAVRTEAGRAEARGSSSEDARAAAAARVFGSKPGGYGAGLGTLVDSGVWTTRDELGDAYRATSGYTYGGGRDGMADADTFTARLATIDLVAQAQDTREHDVLDSDDYYQFMGGLAAAVAQARGRAPRIAHVDTSRPEQPVVRPLAGEIARVVRGRAANPRWIDSVLRHGYKGAAEIAATVDFLFGFAACTDAVQSHHFDQLFEAYIADERVHEFMSAHNPAALAETLARFAEARRRGFWQPRSNSAAAILDGDTRQSRDSAGF